MALIASMVWVSTLLGPGARASASAADQATSANSPAPSATLHATSPTPHATYPVRWDFLLNATEAAAEDGPDVAPAGSNLPCTPSSAHPYPVVLVHGLGADQSDNWGALSPFLADNGYCVFSLTYGNDPSAPGFLSRIGGFADMTQSAQVLAAFVQHVLQVTGAPKIDIVGHSEGGTMPDWYLKFDGGSRYVAHFVALSGVLHGTTLWGTAKLYWLLEQFGYSGQPPIDLGSLCISCTEEFFPTSAWMTTLDAPNPTATASEAATCPVDGAAVDGVAYTSIATTYDELVQPDNSDFINPACATSATGISVQNILIQDQCPQDFADHLSIAADPNAAQDILNALDPAHAKAVSCTLVLPSVG